MCTLEKFKRPDYLGGAACRVEADDLLDALVEDREEWRTGPCSLLWRRLDFVLGMIEQVTWGNSTT